MKYRSSKRAKALAISPETKAAVWKRDGRCVYCGSPNGRPNAHYIPRSLGGLGIEQNILTLCFRCHREYDEGTREQREGMREFFSEYLMTKYPEWDETKLIYHKEGL